MRRHTTAARKEAEGKKQALSSTHRFEEGGGGRKHLSRRNQPETIARDPRRRFKRITNTGKSRRDSSRENQAVTFGYPRGSWRRDRPPDNPTGLSSRPAGPPRPPPPAARAGPAHPSPSQPDEPPSTPLHGHARAVIPRGLFEERAPAGAIATPGAGAREGRPGRRGAFGGGARAAAVWWRRRTRLFRPVYPCHSGLDSPRARPRGLEPWTWRMESRAG